MADVTESVANEAVPLSGAVRVDGYETSVPFRWKFPAKEELEQRKSQMRRDLQKYKQENPLHRGLRLEPQLDTIIDAVFRLNHGGIHGHEKLTKEDVMLLWYPVAWNKGNTLPLLDKRFIDPLFVEVFRRWNGPSDDSSEFKRFFKKYQDFICQILEQFALANSGWDMEGMYQVQRDTPYWEPNSIKNSIHEYLNAVARSFAKEPQSSQFWCNFVDLTNLSGWRNQRQLTDSIFLAMLEFSDVNTIWGVGPHGQLPEMLLKPEVTLLSTIEMKELEAGFIESGWFQFETTVSIHEHLKFDGATGTILIYKDPWVVYGHFERLSVNHMSRLMGVDELLREIFQSYYILFGSDRVIFTRGKMDIDGKPAVLVELEPLNSFKYLGDRLRTIHEEMQAWRPQSLRHLFKPGYKDRFNYYTQMFALFIAGLGLLGVILSMIQTAYAIVAVKIALEALEIQKQQMLNATRT